MNCDANCELQDLLTDKDKTGEKLVYGKKMLTSHRNYNLWNEETDEFNIPEICEFYKYFVSNVKTLGQVFEPRWVYPHELLTTSKGLIWDWTSEEEKIENAEGIDKHGVYFPILTLERGLLHNQIMSDEEKRELSSKMLYNSYNGNHRIDCMKYLIDEGIWNKDRKVLIYIIPPFCQKSCTGFKYAPIDDEKECDLTKYKLANPIKLIHMDRVEHEMKVTNWREKTTIRDGISKVTVDNFNVAFRILIELQNILEPVLVRYYSLYKKFPDGVSKLSKVFNDKDAWDRVMDIGYSNQDIAYDMCVSYTDANKIAAGCEHGDGLICKAKDIFRICERSLCCGACPTVDSCECVCSIITKAINSEDVYAKPCEIDRDRNP